MEGDPEENPPDTKEEEHAEEVVTTAQKIEDIIRRAGPIPEDDEVVYVDKTALNAILDVSARLKDMQKGKNKYSMSTLALGHESYKDKQASIKS